VAGNPSGHGKASGLRRLDGDVSEARRSRLATCAAAIEHVNGRFDGNGHEKHVKARDGPGDIASGSDRKFVVLFGRSGKGRHGSTGVRTGRPHSCLEWQETLPSGAK